MAEHTHVPPPRCTRCWAPPADRRHEAGRRPAAQPRLPAGRRPHRPALPRPLHVLRLGAAGHQPAGLADDPTVPGRAGRDRRQQAGQPRHVHHGLRRVRRHLRPRAGRPGPAPPVLRRGRGAGGRERAEGRLRLEEPAQRGRRPRPPAGHQGAAPDPRVPRPLRLHPVAHQHRPGQDRPLPKFDWPRIDVPAIRFPLADHLAEVEAAEQHALEQARRAFAAHPHDIAAFIAEPIQGEGGDNHFRAEFFAALREIVHAHDALFVFDEVQTGVGTTGSAWAYQHLGVQPDLVAFAKKAQVGGIMAGGRIDEVPDNVFTVPGGSTPPGAAGWSTWSAPAAPRDHRGRRPHRAGRAQGRAPAGRPRPAGGTGWSTTSGAGACSRPATCPTRPPRRPGGRPADSSTSSCCPAGSARSASVPPCPSPRMRSTRPSRPSAAPSPESAAPRPEGVAR